MPLRQKVSKLTDSTVIDDGNVSVPRSEMVCALMGACETKSIALVHAQSRVISICRVEEATSFHDGWMNDFIHTNMTIHVDQVYCIFSVFL